MNIFAALVILAAARAAGPVPSIPEALEKDLEVVVGHPLTSPGVFMLEAPGVASRQERLRLAAHGVLLGAIDLDSDKKLAAKLAFARTDDFLAPILARRGADSTDAFFAWVEEDAAQAWGQFVAERCGFAEDPWKRWGTREGSDHVLAVALYDLLTMEPKDAPLRPMREQLLRWVEEDRLATGEIRQRFLSYYSDERRPTTREDALPGD